MDNSDTQAIRRHDGDTNAETGEMAGGPQEAAATVTDHGWTLVNGGMADVEGARTGVEQLHVASASAAAEDHTTEPVIPGTRYMCTIVFGSELLLTCEGVRQRVAWGVRGGKCYGGYEKRWSDLRGGTSSEANQHCGQLTHVYTEKAIKPVYRGWCRKTGTYVLYVIIICSVMFYLCRSQGILKTKN